MTPLQPFESNQLGQCYSNCDLPRRVIVIETQIFNLMQQTEKSQEFFELPYRNAERYEHLSSKLKDLVEFNKDSIKRIHGRLDAAEGFYQELQSLKRVAGWAIVVLTPIISTAISWLVENIWAM